MNDDEENQMMDVSERSERGVVMGGRIRTGGKCLR